MLNFPEESQASEATKFSNVRCSFDKQENEDTWDPFRHFSSGMTGDIFTLYRVSLV